MQMRENVGKSRNTVFFQWFVAPEGRKVGSLKQRVRSHLARREIKNCTPLWREAHFQLKMYKTHQLRTTFGSWDVEKVHTVVAWRTFQSQFVQNTPCTDHFWTFRSRFAWQAQGIVHLVKSEQNVRVRRISKNDGRRGTFEEGLQRCIFRGRRSTTNIFIGAVRRWGRWFSERLHFGASDLLILRDRCSTSYDLASLFRGRRSTFDRWTGKIAKRIGTRPSALHSAFHFWRKSRRIALFLMLSSSKIEEVSQNCFVLDVVQFKKWTELLRFWFCQFSKNEEVSQESFVFKLADRQIERQANTQR